jgi:AcrR family transcriptional regulator
MGRNKTIDDIDLLAAAREVFRQRGHSASTRDVARAAGISQAVLYQRFSSKDDLFFRALVPDPPDLEALFGPYPPKDAFKDLLGIAERLATYLRYFMPTLLHVLAFPGVDSTKLKDWHRQLPFLPIADALTGRFRRMNADGLTACENPHASAIAFMSTIHSLVFFEVLTSHEDRQHRPASVRAMLLALWRGFEPRK